MGEPEPDPDFGRRLRNGFRRAVREVQRATAVVVQTGPFLADMVVDGPFRDRFLELAGKGLARTIQALAAGASGNAASKELLLGETLARWFVDAGGEFPKLAQVLAVQADLVRHPAIRRELSTVLEKCQPAPLEDVTHAIRCSAPRVLEACGPVGEHLNAGSIAQVNALGQHEVVKVAWSENLQKMRIDFRLFKQCRQVLVALKLEGHVDAQLVERMMHLVVLSEESTIAEFDMLREARIMEMAQAMLGDTWRDSWMDWANRLDLTAFPQLTSMQRQGEARPGMLDELMRCHGPHVRAPTVRHELCSDRVLVMERVGGRSVASLLENADAVDWSDVVSGGLPGVVRAQRVEPTRSCGMGMAVVLGVIAPLQGYMLLCTSDTHGAHVDPHPGNFRYDEEAKTLWMLDWGGFLLLKRHERLNMCGLIVAVDDHLSGTGDRQAHVEAIKKSMRALKFEGTDLAEVAIQLFSLRTDAEAVAQGGDPLACLSGLDVMPAHMAPMVRAIGIIRGMLSGASQQLPDEMRHQISLAALWRPFAEQGLRR